MKKKGILIVALLGILAFGLMPAYAQAPGKITLKFVDAYKADQYTVVKFLDFFNEIGKRSNGRLEIIRAGGPEVIPMQDQLTACGKGAIDIVLANPNYYAGVVPEGLILGLPAVFWDFSNALKYTNGVIDDLDKIYRKKTNVMIVPGSYSIGGIYILTKSKAVTSAADMKGMKIRTYGGYDAILLDAFGAAATRVAPAEIYTAAERGVIDGASRPAQSVIDWREYEVWKYFTKTPSSFMIAGLVAMNVDRFNKLPADLQTLMMDMCRESGPAIGKYFENKENEAIAFLASKGVQMVDLKPGEKAQWESIPAAAVEQYYLKQAGEGGKALLDKLKAIAK
jgi:TRAP-type transport system periplasmic protein